MASQLLDKVTKIVNELVCLEVVTIVGAASLTVDTDKKIKFTLPNDATARAMITRVDLVTGDIQNIIHPEFVAGDLTGMRDFHAGQVTKGHDVIINNIKAMRELALALRDN